jgi:hypothetical protein
MGFGECRFGCGEKTNIDYTIPLKHLNTGLQVCGLWQHYMEVHNVKPKKEIRDLIFGKPVDLAKLPKTPPLDYVKVLYVEKTDSGYDHEVGESPDWEFIHRLDDLIHKFGRERLSFV